MIRVLSNDKDRKRLKNEARALSRLNHPNIETIYAFETEDDVEFLVIELLSGTSLSDKIVGPLSENEIMRFGMQIADALSAAHRHGVIHRDLKPSNVFLDLEGHIKVLDFGLAKLHAVVDSDATESISMHLGPVGTVPYMSPEQLLNGTVDERSDIYSFGAVLYQMATAQRPFHGKHGVALQHAIMNELPVSPLSLNPGISPELDRIILKCLEKDPNARYQSAKEIGIDLLRLTSYISRQIVAQPQPIKKGKVAAIAHGCGPRDCTRRWPRVETAKLPSLRPNRRELLFFRLRPSAETRNRNTWPAAWRMRLLDYCRAYVHCR